MTVKELIELLKKYPDDTKVKTNGCQMCVHEITGCSKYKDQVWLEIQE